MARRLQPGSSRTSARPTDEPTSSNDSQNDSSELEAGEGQKPEPQFSSPPPKKKRTRTLTTPHQAAVLHALLAKSRFPNTAMREEVGRSIGLSARKVQNQRQKARRPRSQSDASQKQSHQFGAFSSGPANPALGSFPVVPERGSRPNLEPSTSFSSHAESSMSRGYHSPDSEPLSDAVESSAQLLGPGMPGSELPPELPYRGHPTVPLRPSTAYELPTRYDNPRAIRSPTPPRLHPTPAISRPSTASRAQDRDFSRTLPPLVFNPSRPTFSAPGPSSGHHTAFVPGYASGRSLSPDTVFAHLPPQSTSISPIAPSPPYVLQPRPQWETPSFGAALRSSTASTWGHRSASASITPPALPTESAAVTEAPVAEEDATEIRPPQRSRRYDPVRATFIYSSPDDER
ncbi:hypothetical protein DXG01_004306 [Tephrocybe rancida]|nr:hypothetical protein DXG01_004306 [Tephrocybe rancida]